MRSARRAVLALTPITAARSRAGGSRSPGMASPSAIARRISAATWSWSATEFSRLTLTGNMVPVIIAPMTLETPPRPAHTETQDLDALIKEARRRARRRKMLYALAALLVAGGIAAGVGTSLSGGHGPTSTGSAIPVIWGKASSSMKGTLTGVVSQAPPTRIVLFAAQPRSHSFRLLDNGPFKPG